MRKRLSLIGFFLGSIASASLAGHPNTENQTCPIGGQTFTSTGTASCTTFGGSQDFFMKVQSSCDFVTRLPRCPDNGLPLYKQFSPTEIALLKTYMSNSEYLAMVRRSRFYVAKRIDDYLVSKGSAREINFWHLLGGLQFDRNATINDLEYMALLKSAGQAELTKANNDDAPYIRLVLAYLSYRSSNFAASASELSAIRGDVTLAGNKFVQAYLTRLSACVVAKDTNMCPADEQVMSERQQRSLR